MKGERTNPGIVLLVEDERSDATLVTRAFAKAGVQNPLVHLPDAKAAMGYLLGVGEYSDRIRHPLPILVLLDLRMPVMTGLEFLQWLRTQKDLRKIPVVVLTSDADSQTVNAAYQLGANSYLVKPGTPAEVLRVVSLIQQYWLQLNEPPKLVVGARRSEQP